VDFDVMKGGGKMEKTMGSSFFLVIPPLQDICWYDGMIRVCVLGLIFCDGSFTALWVGMEYVGGRFMCIFDYLNAI
jgi:hypothetical protein